MLAVRCWCALPAAIAVVANTPARPTTASHRNTRIFTLSLPGVVRTLTWSYGYFLLPPARAVRERILGERLGPDLDAVARCRRREVAAADDADRVDEVLVEMVDE